MHLENLRRAFEPAIRRVLHFYWRFARGLTLGVRGMVIDGAGRVFLVKHSYVAGWHLPGGGVEVGETLTAALTRDFGRFLSLVIVDYGTGIRVAAPTSVLSSMTHAARAGIVIKSGGHMEKLAKADTIVFDKTGTLTHGVPAIVDIIGYVDHITPGHLLGLAAAAEIVASALGMRTDETQPGMCEFSSPGRSSRADIRNAWCRSDTTCRPR